MENYKKKFTKHISLEEWYEDYALEIEDMSSDDFLSVMETLTRIGVYSAARNAIYQSCHIFYKRDRYYIVHFKELFALDGRPVNITEEDIKRRNLIASLLEEWGMIRILEPEKAEPKAHISAIKIIKYNEKDQYNLVPKYTIGNKR